MVVAVPGGLSQRIVMGYLYTAYASYDPYIVEDWVIVWSARWFPPGAGRGRVCSRGRGRWSALGNDMSSSLPFPRVICFFVCADICFVVLKI